ncbi:hypothetical protein ES703_110378 [subsurface metagenome]
MRLSAKLFKLTVTSDTLPSSNGETLIPVLHPVIIGLLSIRTLLACSSMMPLYFMSDIVLFEITTSSAPSHMFMPHVWSDAPPSGFFMSVMVFPEMTMLLKVLPLVFAYPTLIPHDPNVLEVPVSLLTCVTMLSRICTLLTSSLVVWIRIPVASAPPA